ncbi:hypothetical protein [Streptomyces sp. NBC_01718]|uniref:hypothetical protein n=1 Tax=unclassified Streptomyces TaxID=2593676 RepID=UPI0030DFE1B2
MDIRAAYHGRGMRQWVRWTAGTPSRAPVRRAEVKAATTPAVIRDGRATPLKVITTAVNVNDVSQTLALVAGIPPVAGRPGRRARRRPEALLGDKVHDSDAHRKDPRERRILPVISRKGSPNIKGMGAGRLGNHGSAGVFAGRGVRG